MVTSLNDIAHILFTQHSSVGVPVEVQVNPARCFKQFLLKKFLMKIYPEKKSGKRGVWAFSVKCAFNNGNFYRVMSRSLGQFGAYVTLNTVQWLAKWREAVR